VDAAGIAYDEHEFDTLAGDSLAIERVRQAIARAARVDSTILLEGETGTGKDLVARLIHRASPRQGRPFVVVNCSSLPADQLEAELFGHERGAGGATARRGRIEEAEGGTVLLDEVGDLPRTLQPKILRFLQDHTIRPVGGGQDRPADVRIIAATQRNLREATESGEFRSDLYYRLAAVPLELPPLRTHAEDVPVLARHLVVKLTNRLGRSPVDMGDDVLAVLAQYPFPGNVRELQNVLERALVLGIGDSGRRHIEPRDLPEHVSRPQPWPAPKLPLEGGLTRLQALVAHLERDVIQRAVQTWPHLSNTQIAGRLGTNRRVFELRLRQYGITKPRAVNGATAPHPSDRKPAS
jgi:transcriptional regulator with GAF, ATPase, and Fis domain